MIAIAFAMHVAILTGEVVLLGMIWHISHVAHAHHQRADLEWKALREKFDSLREKLS